MTDSADEAGNKSRFILSRDDLQQNESAYSSNNNEMSREEVVAEVRRLQEFSRAQELAARAENAGKQHQLGTVADYIDTRYQQDITAFQQISQCKTGYANIDRIQRNLSPGLYVLGAVPSLGKTTFLNQMADQIAETKRDVVFFSLEQSQLELTTKSLARMQYLKVLEDPKLHDFFEDHASTALQIRTNKGQDVQHVANSYSKTIGQYKYIVPLDYSATVNDIKATLAPLLDRSAEKRPVVIVDYLQALAPINPRMQTRDAVNYNIEALKTLQRDNELIVWVISSFNRASYYSPITLEAFKESGGIEFTADYVCGLQLHAINSRGLGQAPSKEIDELRKTAQEAKKQIPRVVDYVCLKNRFGSDYTCSFLYDAAYECFIPNLADRTEKQHVPERDIEKIVQALELGKKDKKR